MFFILLFLFLFLGVDIVAKIYAKVKCPAVPSSKAVACPCSCCALWRAAGGERQLRTRSSTGAAEALLLARIGAGAAPASMAALL